MINYKLAWCGGIVNNQIKKGLLLSVSEKKSFKTDEYLAKLQARKWLSHALYSSFLQCGGQYKVLVTLPNIHWL